MNFQITFDFNSSKFETLLSTTYYVDKTLLIKALFEEKTRKIVVTAPRRFGKSTNLDMIKRFVEIEMDREGKRISKTNYKLEPVKDTPTYDLFIKKDLEIIKHCEIMNEHFGRYPVVYADFKRNSFVQSFQDAVNFCKTVVSKSFQQHKYLKESKKLSGFEKERCKLWCEENDFDKDDVIRSLEELSRYLCRHFNKKKVFVFIDDFDAVIAKAIFKLKGGAELRDVVEFNKSLMFTLLKKCDESVDRIFITGISHIISRYLFDVEDIKLCAFLGKHEFVKFYGLTPEEVEHLFQISLISLHTPQSIEDAYDRYNAYTSENNEKIHNLWSILNFVVHGEIKDYWRMSLIIENFYEILKNSNIRLKVEELTHDKPINIEIPESISYQQIAHLRFFVLEPKERNSFYYVGLFFLYLFEQGYLSYHHNKEVSLPSNQIFVKVPNKELEEEFLESLTRYYVITFVRS
ncbi:hypothetical protein ILUMI_16499 [Ignelater luminosus]|uniref:AAA-ATPase-like domain-containing protein n=1 Tax=Ignelater luminosus TaxID=2038154 RepID=A0A8K0CLN2_IGNLU|nr:hypothetical protein ILUMI_16499 [Ignelater luminosus]